MDEINSKMKMSNVSKYNPIHNVVGGDYDTVIPEMKVDENDEMNKLRLKLFHLST